MSSQSQSDSWDDDIDSDKQDNKSSMPKPGSQASQSHLKGKNLGIPLTFISGATSAKDQVTFVNNSKLSIEKTVKKPDSSIIIQPKVKVCVFRYGHSDWLYFNGILDTGCDDAGYASEKLQKQCKIVGHKNKHKNTWTGSVLASLEINNMNCIFALPDLELETKNSYSKFGETNNHFTDGLDILIGRKTLAYLEQTYNIFIGFNKPSKELSMIPYRSTKNFSVSINGISGSAFIDSGYESSYDIFGIISSKIFKEIPQPYNHIGCTSFIFGKELYIFDKLTIRFQNKSVEFKEPSFCVDYKDAVDINPDDNSEIHIFLNTNLMRKLADHNIVLSVIS